MNDGGREGGEDEWNVNARRTRVKPNAVGRVIQEWIDAQPFDVSAAKIASKMNPPAARSTVANWLSGKATPRADELRALHVVLTGVPYWRLCDAVLVDLGYVDEREVRRGG